jgi:hypothetical protein
MDGPIPATPAQISMFHNVRLSKVSNWQLDYGESGAYIFL